MTSTTKNSIIRRGTAVTAAVAIGAALTAAPALAAVGQPGTDRPSIALPASAMHRGELVSATLIRQLSRAQVIAELTEAGFDPATARHGVTLYRLVYRTI